MRSTLRMAALICVLLVMFLPAASYADGPCGGCGCAAPCPAGNPCYGLSTTGPCPDDPELSKTCDKDPPPYYVVVNRQVECLNRNGSGCAPFILKHDCADCNNCNVDVQAEVCRPLLTGKVPAGQTAIVYEMCCTGTAWQFQVRELQSNGDCPVINRWIAGLPPGTGINLPAPVIVGGLAVLGVGFVGLGVVIRRKTAR